jgi:glycerophosphoryl diester phosphodiesterase
MPRLLALLLTLGVVAAAEPRPLIIAHRGASGYLPEHTLAAKALAYGQGADYLEQDVVLSKDGVPVVFHDPHIDTTTDVAKKFPNRQRADGRFYQNICTDDCDMCLNATIHC